MNPATAFAALHGHKYLNLETFRKNGTGVRTPVWFAAEPENGPEKSGASPPQKLYVYSTADSGKAKRIRNNPLVRVAPSDMRGRPLGDWIEARAEIVTGAEAEQGMRRLNKKYFPWKQVLDFFSMFGRKKRVMFLIRPA
jgi:PPOX class probable F420-dependent enzyme